MHRVRFRALLRWSLSVLTALMLAALLLTYWFWFQATDYGLPNTAYSARGIVGFIHGPRLPYDTRKGLYVRSFARGAGPGTDLSWHWSPHYWSRPEPFGRYTQFEVEVPLWIPILLTGVPSLLLWRKELRRRERARSEVGACANCGYDRRGLAAAKSRCPECGSV